MKMLSALAVLMLGTTAALAAEPTNDPRAEVFRAAGCDAEFLRPVTNAAGEILYWNNTDGKGCPTQPNGGETIYSLIERAEQWAAQDAAESN